MSESLLSPYRLVPVISLLTITPVHASDLIESFHVRSKAGSVEADATLHFDASPTVVQALLTDYEHWPELFSVRMRMVRVERYPDRTVTDLLLKHGLLGGERRLLCENRILPGGGLSTALLEGDFRRYARTWHLRSNDSERTTRADFRLEVEIDTWAPDWLMVMVLKQELKEHFVIVDQKAKERAAGTSTP